MGKLTKEVKSFFISHGIAFAAGSLATLLTVGIGNSGPNSYLSALQAQTGTILEGGRADLYGIDQAVLPKGATETFLLSILQQSAGSAQENTLQVYADTACITVSASGLGLDPGTLTMLSGATDSRNSSELQSYDAGVAYQKCLSIILGDTAKQTFDIPTGVGPIPSPSPSPTLPSSSN